MEPRTSQFVLSKLSNLISSSESEAGLRQYWMPDDISVECYDCTSKFTSFRRRHHCRVCGQIFCSKCCSSYIPGKQIGYSGNLRVCTFCYSFFETYLEQGLPTDAAAGPGDNMGRRWSVDETSQSQVPGSPAATFRSSRKAGSSAHVYESMGRDTVVGGDEESCHDTVKLRDPAALSRLWQRVLEPGEGLALETHRYYFRSYPGTFLAHNLVDWLVSRQDRCTSRSQGVAIGQAFLAGGYMTSLSGQAVFGDNNEVFQPEQRAMGQDQPDVPSTPEPNVQEPLWLQQLADAQVQPRGVSAVKPKAGGEKEVRKVSGEKNLSEQQTLQFDLLKESLQEQVGVGADSSTLDLTYQKHEKEYLNRLLEGAKLEPHWADIAVKLADEAVRKVTPDPRNSGDEMDIRWYVKVKCVPGGDPSESSLVPGEVCTLQPAHRNMASTMSQPSIALVANSIVFQRDENRLVSLETLWMQEEEYIKNMTGKLLAARPNIIMVERTVSRLAQDIFRREGVTLVLNVKYRVLERLARLTQAKIISSVDSMLAPPKLGTCSSFYMNQFCSGPLSHRLMVFDGCPVELGGTVVLRGGSKHTLAKVKGLLKLLLLIKHNWKHEKSFILNEYGCQKDGEEECDIDVKENVDDTNPNKLIENGTENNPVSHRGECIKASENSKYKLTLSPFIKVEQSTDGIHFAHDVSNDVHDIVVENNDLAVCSATHGDQDIEGHVAPHRHPWCQNFISAHIRDSVDDRNVQNMLALFRAAGWRQNQDTSSGPSNKSRQYTRSVSFCQPNPFPLDQGETLSVLFSSYSSISTVAPNYCVSPWVVNMELYGNLDITLGGFLEDFCFSSEYQCPNRQCSTPITEHSRRFCHAGGGVEVHLQRLEAPIMGDNDRLMMWKYCTSCQLITPIVPVTNDTWSLSFAMFLQLLLHDKNLARRGYDRPDAVCQHSIHQEHLTCFGKRDLVATFRYSQLQVWHVATPPPTLDIPLPPSDRDSLLARLRQYKKHGSSVYSTVLEQLLVAKMEMGESAVANLLGDQEQEFAQYRTRVEQLEEEVMASEEHNNGTLTQLHLLARDIVMTQRKWNTKLNSVAEAAKATKKQFTTLNRSSSTELLDSLTTVSKKPEADTTVKKLLSAMLPPSEEPSIPSPFPPDTHIITSVGGQVEENPIPLFVAESQPSSIIAYLLSSQTYKDFLSQEPPKLELVKKVSEPGHGKKLPGLPSLPSISEKEWKEESPGHDMDGIHFELQFSDDTTKFYCCSYFPHSFDNLRELIFPDRAADFLSSLAGCRRWDANGGKSGLSFFKTDDNRFILKQMSRFEFQSFLEFAPHYFQYLTECLSSNCPTLLGKIVGVYKLGFKNSSTGAGLKMDVLVMENLFYNRDITKSYDLKGAIRNRFVSEGKNDLGLVLLDENLVRVSCESPLYINSLDKQLLQEAIRRDPAFLASHNMMDYSLLAGICKTSGELVLGIIDYIRTFTWDKKLETLMKSVKSSGYFGGQAKTPTVIHPDLYKHRFSEAMNRYFLPVPD